MQAPKTNFTAVAAAVKDVAARNAAAASVQSEWKDEHVAVPADVEDVLRDPPESGKPIDETDRYSSHSWLAYCYLSEQFPKQATVVHILHLRIVFRKEGSGKSVQEVGDDILHIP